MRYNPWIAVVAAVVFALVVGAMAYNAGVSQGISQGVSQSGRVAAAPGAPAGAYPYPYPYYGYWHGGPFFYSPLLFILIGLSVLRMMFWGARGRWYRGHCGYGDLDEWHRQAHQGTPPQP